MTKRQLTSARSNVAKIVRACRDLLRLLDASDAPRNSTLRRLESESIKTRRKEPGKREFANATQTKRPAER